MKPVAILRVEDRNGNIIEQHMPSREEVLRKETAYIITDLLKTVLKKGTGQTASWKYGFTRPGGGTPAPASGRIEPAHPGNERKSEARRKHFRQKGNIKIQTVALKRQLLLFQQNMLFF